MKYRTKIFLTISSTVVLINSLTLALMYDDARRSLFEEIGNNALSIAATTSAFVGANEHKNIHSQADENSASYQQILDTLKRARDANRRPDTHVRFLYTFMPQGADRSDLRYGVDPEEDSHQKNRFGEPLRNEGRQMILDQTGVDTAFSKDDHGSFLTANAPVRDSSGSVVAAVGVDFPERFVKGKLNRLALDLCFCFGLGIMLAALVGAAFSARAAKPVSSLCEAMEAMGVSRRELIQICAGRRPIVQTERRRVTVLFSDIREFTGMSENMRPEDVATLLNEYFERMVEVVSRHQGIIDKFMGDGLMALFGAPDDDCFQEEHAVKAALDMQQELRILSEKWTKEGRRPLRIGIGINSGNAVVGNLGSERRLEYTAIGDTVNLASRLESLTKDLKADVLISEYTYQGLKGSPFSITKMPAQEVPGHEPVTVYAVAVAKTASA